MAILTCLLDILHQNQYCKWLFHSTWTVTNGHVSKNNCTPTVLDLIMSWFLPLEEVCFHLLLSCPFLGFLIESAAHAWWQQFCGIPGLSSTWTLMALHLVSVEAFLVGRLQPRKIMSMAHTPKPRIGPCGSMPNMGSTENTWCQWIYAVPTNQSKYWLMPTSY